MAHSQALNAKRGVAFTFDPGDLTIVTDKDDPLYDERVENPIPDGAILDAALRGIIEPIVVRRRGEESVVIDGIQRTKRALVVNAIVGISYKGDIQAVHDAVKRIDDAHSASGDDSLARRIMKVCAGGLKLPAVARNGGSDGDAYGVKVALNTWREDDPTRVRIAKAQRMGELSYAADDIAAAMNGSVATVKRWLKVDLNTPASAKKKRGKATRPSVKKIQKVRDAAEKHLGTDSLLMVALDWVRGKVETAELVDRWPVLRGKI